MSKLKDNRIGIERKKNIKRLLDANDFMKCNPSFKRYMELTGNIGLDDEIREAVINYLNINMIDGEDNWYILNAKTPTYIRRRDFSTSSIRIEIEDKIHFRKKLLMSDIESIIVHEPRLSSSAIEAATRVFNEVVSESIKYIHNAFKEHIKAKEEDIEKGNIEYVSYCDFCKSDNALTSFNKGLFED